MKGKIFKRKIYSKILKWKEENNGGTALLIEGARRVGKSTIVREFAEKEYESFIIIDFNKVDSVIKDLFNNLNDLDYLFLVLQTEYHVSLKKRKSVIIFDEVQKCPQARQAIKYLVEDGRYDYIETGSLISIKQHTQNITIPSEEDRISMYPMDFEEFEWAIGNSNLIETLKIFWNQKKSLGNLHRSIMKDFRLYMLVGGMPQAVEEYIETNDFSKVDKVKRRILKLYEDDFLKIDSTGRLSKLFISIPSQLSRNARRYSINSVVGRQTEDTILEMVKALADSKTVNVAYHSDDPNVGMNLTKNDQNFKLYIADTGLFITLIFWDKDFIENIIYQKLLLDKLSANLGYVYENLVSQMLVSKGNELFYYTWKKDDKHYYEIDFLISSGFKLCPIEVKSSNVKSHISLDLFYQKFSSRIYRNYLVAPHEYSQDGEVTIIPPYFLPFIK